MARTRRSERDYLADSASVPSLPPSLERTVPARKQTSQQLYLHERVPAALWQGQRSMQMKQVMLMKKQPRRPVRAEHGSRRARVPACLVEAFLYLQQTTKEAIQTMMRTKGAALHKLQQVYQRDRRSGPARKAQTWKDLLVHLRFPHIADWALLRVRVDD